MTRRYRDREQAGRELADRLLAKELGDVIVLGLPRGGVPVAYEVARALGAPLDVSVVRKLGVPGQKELAMGAVATGGVRVLNEGLLVRLQLPASELERIVRSEEAEILRQEERYRPGRGPADVRGRTVVVVDDGLATGSTMRAAVAALRQLAPVRIVVAVPTASEGAVAAVASEADDVVSLDMPDPFWAVGMSYDDFSEVTDDEVSALLASAAL